MEILQKLTDMEWGKVCAERAAWRLANPGLAHLLEGETRKEYERATIWEPLCYGTRPPEMVKKWLHGDWDTNT